MRQSTKPISPLRQRMIEDMTLRKLSPKTQIAYVRAVANFTRFFGRSPDTAEAEFIRPDYSSLWYGSTPRVLTPPELVALCRDAPRWQATIAACRAQGGS